MNNPFRNHQVSQDWHLTEDDLILYVGGELTAKESVKASEHLQVCWTCRTKMAGIEETISGFVSYMDAALVPSLGSPPRGWQTFQSRLRHVMDETRKAPTRSFAPLRSLLAAWRLSFRHVTGVVLTVLVVILAIVFRNPRISADQLIQKAVAQEQRAPAVPQPVVYQRLQLWRQSNKFAEDGTVTWEIWNDVANGRFRQRAEYASGQDFGSPRLERAIGPTDRESRRLPPVRGGAHYETSELAALPLVREFQQILRANEMNPERPLSAIGYASWRKFIWRSSEGVKDTTLPGGGRALMLTTAAEPPFRVNAIIKAALLVRTKDWHLVEQRLEVQETGGVQDYELTEAASEVVPLNSLDPSIFVERTAPPPAAVTPPRGTPFSSLSPSAAESLAAEINAQYALHRLKACVGEPIEISRDSAGHVEVRTVTESPERKQQLLTALRGIPLVRASIQTIAEASAGGPTTPQSLSGAEAQNEGSTALQGAIIHVQGSKLPIEDQLREYFTALPGATGGGSEPASIDQQIVEISNRAVALALAASAEAGALRQLAVRYPPSRNNELDPASRWLVEVMVRDHLAALKTQMDQSGTLLGPILCALERGNAKSAPVKDSPVSDLSDSADSNWVAQAFHIFAWVQNAEQLTDYLFAHGTFPGGREEAVAALLADLNRSEDEFQNFQAEVDEDFTGGARLADVEDHPH